MKDTKILAIETSCDETAIAVVKNGRHILSNVIASQMNVHQKYGGIVPEIASRKHMEYILSTCQRSLEEAKMTLKDIDGVAVVNGPGLKGSLLVGLSFAKAIAYALNKPLIAVNHIEGHIYANFLSHDKIENPFISLIVSGGHTSLILVKEMGKYHILGQTRDDAAGEVFDKIAKYLDLGYPGGPAIEKLASAGNKNAFHFPRPLMKSNNFDFSFSGLKTAVIYFMEKKKEMNEKIRLEDVCASFQQAVIDTLVYKTISAAIKSEMDRIAVGGGVAANEGLRKELIETADKKNISVFFPLKELCTDNAAMVGAAAYYKLKRGITNFFDVEVFTG